MAALETIKKELGYKALFFKLMNTVDNQLVDLNELKGKNGTLVMFICNHCPYVLHINEQLVLLANDYMPKGISFIAISSNDVSRYPDDAPDKMKLQAQQLNYPFPYLYDESQDVAKAYFAACTPDFSIFDNELNCVYRGQLDDSRPKSNIPVTGNDIRNALDKLLNNQGIVENQYPSLGCSIKWKL
ncbi:MAG: thioredoxin family protein [Bacteroidetes bacterium]|nr:thioredoxin family protein [Bacteroidota bacterium]